MSAEKMRTIIRVIRVLNALKGQGWGWRLGEISQWSRIPRATCYRYLMAMIEMDMIERGYGYYKGKKTDVYAATEVAFELEKIGMV